MLVILVRRILLNGKLSLIQAMTFCFDKLEFVYLLAIVITNLHEVSIERREFFPSQESYSYD